MNLSVEDVVVGSSQKSTGSTGKKRKAMVVRSKRWQGYERYKDPETGVQMAKCLTCSILLRAPSTAGTSVLVNHRKSCAKKHGVGSSNQKELVPMIGAAGERSLSMHKFDANAIRLALVKMIIMDELPFKFVLGMGFKQFMAIACPRFVIPSRWTIQRDCYQLFLDESKRLKSFFRKSPVRICLTTDTWTSMQKINYMCVTAHYIDNEWKLNKKLLSFTPISTHRGKDIGMAIEKILNDWNIQKIFTVTVDNASSNDTAISYLKEKMRYDVHSVMQCELMHIRCVAHIINLIVVDGLSINEVSSSIEKVRESIKYVRSSPSRLARFKEIAKIEKVECKGWLSLDVPTRWNSTYLMMETAIKFETVFQRYEEEDRYFISDLTVSTGGTPTNTDWIYAKRMVAILKHFYELTLTVSGSSYVTANNFFHELVVLHDLLKQWCGSEDTDLSAMATKMTSKFEKYWGAPGKMNKLLYIATVFDPRRKLDYLQFVLSDMYETEIGNILFAQVKEKLHKLFDDYKYRLAPSGTGSANLSEARGNTKVSEIAFSSSHALKRERMNRFRQARQEGGYGDGNKSELEKYLSEDLHDDDDSDSESFDILAWWKVNSVRFPILSTMARDILAVPISTVASEATFSTGGRILDSFRSSLTPRIVESLLCSQDWLRGLALPNEIEENVEDVEKAEEGNYFLYLNIQICISNFKIFFILEFEKLDITS